MSVTTVHCDQTVGWITFYTFWIAGTQRSASFGREITALSR